MPPNVGSDEIDRHLTKGGAGLDLKACAAPHRKPAGFQYTAEASVAVGVPNSPATSRRSKDAACADASQRSHMTDPLVEADVDVGVVVATARRHLNLIDLNHVTKGRDGEAQLAHQRHHHFR